MEEGLPIDFRVLDLAVAQEADELLCRFGIHTRSEFPGHTDCGHRKVLLVARGAILAAGVLQEAVATWLRFHACRIRMSNAEM